MAPWDTCEGYHGQGIVAAIVGISHIRQDFTQTWPRLSPETGELVYRVAPGRVACIQRYPGQDWQRLMLAPFNGFTKCVNRCLLFKLVSGLQSRHKRVEQFNVSCHMISKDLQSEVASIWPNVVHTWTTSYAKNPSTIWNVIRMVRLEQEPDPPSPD